MDFTNSQHLPVPAHSPTTSVDGVYAPASRGESTRMVETWVISEYCNAGNLQDAIMLHNGGLFFVDSVPQMVSSGLASPMSHRNCFGLQLLEPSLQFVQ